MSTEILHAAVAAIRADYSDRADAEFENAVADLLEMHAMGVDAFNDSERFADKGAPYPRVPPNERYLVVARAYLDGAA